MECAWVRCDTVTKCQMQAVYTNSQSTVTRSDVIKQTTTATHLFWCTHHNLVARRVTLDLDSTSISVNHHVLSGVVKLHCHPTTLTSTWQQCAGVMGLMTDPQQQQSAVKYIRTRSQLQIYTDKVSAANA